MNKLRFELQGGVLRHMEGQRTLCTDRYRDPHMALCALMFFLLLRNLNGYKTDVKIRVPEAAA